jgi:hypothetical protein
VFAAIVVIVIVALAARSCSPSRSVGNGAVAEACFTFWQVVQMPNTATAHPLVERARDAASRSQDRVLAADISRASEMYAGNRKLSNQVVHNTLAECEAQGWKATDPCTYGAAVCGRTVGVTTVTS